MQTYSGCKKEFPNSKIQRVHIYRKFRMQKNGGVKRISECKNVADVKRNFRIQKYSGCIKHFPNTTDDTQKYNNKCKLNQRTKIICQEKTLNA